jgi:predicted SnoaL-like aldol condensation-catalyzing enzyme
MIKKEETIEVTSGPKEIVRIYSSFFEESPKKQRQVLRLLIWWAVKHYFKTLLK